MPDRRPHQRVEPGCAGRSIGRQDCSSGPFKAHFASRGTCRFRRAGGDIRCTRARRSGRDASPPSDQRACDNGSTEHSLRRAAVSDGWNHGSGGRTGNHSPPQARAGTQPGPGCRGGTSDRDPLRGPCTADHRPDYGRRGNGSPGMGDASRRSGRVVHVCSVSVRQSPPSGPPMPASGSRQARAPRRRRNAERGTWLFANTPEPAGPMRRLPTIGSRCLTCTDLPKDCPRCGPVFPTAPPAVGPGLQVGWSLRRVPQRALCWGQGPHPPPVILSEASISAIPRAGSPPETSRRHRR